MFSFGPIICAMEGGATWYVETGNVAGARMNSLELPERDAVLAKADLYLTCFSCNRLQTCGLQQVT